MHQSLVFLLLGVTVTLDCLPARCTPNQVPSASRKWRCLRSSTWECCNQASRGCHHRPCCTCRWQMARLVRAYRWKKKKKHTRCRLKYRSNQISLIMPILLSTGLHTACERGDVHIRALPLWCLRGHAVVRRGTTTTAARRVGSCAVIPALPKTREEQRKGTYR